MKYIVANWKSNKNEAEMQSWASEFKTAVASLNLPDVQVVICPTLVHLAQLRYFLPDVPLGAQTLSPFPAGAYTGAVAAYTLKDYVKFAILGHVERRQFFNETDQMVTNQALQALENGITPILAVNDLNWSSQLSQLEDSQLAKCLVMYEPPEAISTNGQNHPADIQKVRAAVQTILNSYKVMGVLYGGSVAPDNVKQFFNEPLLSGMVVGNASLRAQVFIDLLRASV